MAFPFQSVGLFGPPAKSTPRRPRRLRTPLHWFWRNSARAARANASRSRLAFEPLEPRLLLNADVLAVNLTQDFGAQPLDHSLIVQLVQATEQVNAQTVSVQRVQIVDQSNGDAVLAFGDLNEISAISIAGGAGNNTLTVDASSFAGYAAPKISFDGGSGQNNIVFDNTTNTNWTLTGANAGAVSGDGVNLSFENVGNLTGGGNNNNTLTVEKGGTLSGVFDGGAGGGNALVFDNGPHQTAVYTAGPISTITLDGQSLSFENVQSTNMGDPASLDLSGDTNLDLEATQSGNDLVINGINGSTFNTSAAPTAGQAFDLILGAGDTLQVGDSTHAVDFNTLAAGTAFDITGAGSSIAFSGNLTDSSGVSATVNASDTQTISASTIGAESITQSAPIGATITEDSGVTISASTISLEATSSSTETITNTDANANLVTSAAITTTNNAAITINGTLDATGALSVISNVDVNDSIDNSDSLVLHAVTITANDTSGVTFSSSAVVSAATLDAEANTTVNATIDADHIGAGVIPGFVPASLLGIAVEVEANVTNSTIVTVASGASIELGAGTISTAEPVAGSLAATDATNVTTSLTLDNPVSLPVVGNVLVFSALDSSDTLSRTTAVDVGNLAATSAPGSGAADILSGLGGDERRNDQQFRDVDGLGHDRNQRRRRRWRFDFRRGRRHQHPQRRA